MREIDLVGAIHGVAIHSRIGGVSHFEVEPPVDFVDQLEFDQGAKVAIEAAPGGELTAGVFQDPDVDNLSAYERAWAVMRAQAFFGAASRMLTQAGFIVEGIDDNRLRNHVCAEHLALLGDFGADDMYDLNLPRWRQRKLGHSYALLRFLDSSVREDLMLRRLSQGDYSGVIIGQAHADILAATPELQDRLGVEVVRYRRADVRYRGKPLSDKNRPRYSDEHVDAYLYEPDPQELAKDAQEHVVQKELSRRKYNAFRIGRVLSRRDPRPDYIGRYFMSGLAEASLFELRIDDRAGQDFKGTVYDVLGNAAVAGTISSSSIDFVKTYEPKTTSRESAVQPLRYIGRANQQSGNFYGRYRLVGEDTRWGYGFVMTPFDRLAVRRLNDRGYLYKDCVD